MKVFTIKDTKADYYYPPQLYRNSMEAQRACSNAVNEQPDSLFAKNTQDFILFEIGDWNELTGTFDPTEKKHIADLIDLRVE